MKDRIKYLDIARTMAIICVVFNHALNRSFSLYSGQYYSFLTIPLSQTVFEAVAATLSRLGVPLFLMITGTLILEKQFDKEGIVRFYKHNWVSMLVTTEIWLFIMYWILVFKDNAYSWSNVTDNAAINIINMLKTMLFIDQCTMGSMWYMSMILCVYTVLPIIALVKDKLPKIAIIIPVSIVFIASILIPSINDILKIQMKSELVFDLNSANIFSVYLLYVVMGYAIDKGCLSKISNLYIWTIFIIGCVVGVGIQIYSYTSQADVVIGSGYHDFVIFIISGVLFEIIRRLGQQKVKNRIASYIATISFGIYFVHICIMEIIKDLEPFASMIYSFRCLVLSLVSFGGSIIIIAVLSKVKCISRYMFGIKK